MGKTTNKLILVFLLIILTAGVIFKKQLLLASPPISPQPSPANTSPSKPPPNTPQLIATRPSPLDNIIILPTQTIEFIFNAPLQNAPEFKYKIEPAPPEVKTELSSDRKTIKIVPTKPFNLGTSYHLSIEAGINGTKFDNGRLKDSLDFNFRTIDYKGV